MSETLQVPEAANYVGGEWRPAVGGATYERRNPARPSEVVGQFPDSSEEDLNAAVAAAKEALPGWAGTPAPQRGAILLKAAAVIEERVEEIAQAMTREMGKPLRESRLEAGRAAQIFRYFSGEGWRPQGELFE
jgi:alpha-ketoglutaric semialdehyde dehydrogenase